MHKYFTDSVFVLWLLSSYTTSDGQGVFSSALYTTCKIEKQLCTIACRAVCTY